MDVTLSLIWMWPLLEVTPCDTFIVINIRYQIGLKISSLCLIVAKIKISNFWKMLPLWPRGVSPDIYGFSPLCWNFKMFFFLQMIVDLFLKSRHSQGSENKYKVWSLNASIIFVVIDKFVQHYFLVWICLETANSPLQGRTNSRKRFIEMMLFGGLKTRHVLSVGKKSDFFHLTNKNIL